MDSFLGGGGEGGFTVASPDTNGKRACICCVKSGANELILDFVDATNVQEAILHRSPLTFGGHLTKRDSRSRSHLSSNGGSCLEFGTRRYCCPSYV